MASPLWRLCCLVALSAAARAALAADSQVVVQAPQFNLADRERIVLLGSTFIERDQAHGYLEAALVARFWRHSLVFRNLGWSGDTVFGEARAGFGTAADGFAHLKEHVLAIQPTVIFLSYGANESFAGKAGLDSFLAGMNALLAALDETGARVVFVAPPPHEQMPPPLPDPAEHNRNLKLYGDAVAKIAARRGAPSVNLYELLGKKLQPPAVVPLTDNGIHLTPYGYWRAARVIEGALGLPQRHWEIEVDARYQNISARGADVSGARFSSGQIAFNVRDEQLPLPPPPEGSPHDASRDVEPRVVRFFNLAPGRYALKIADAEVCAATAGQWAGGVTISAGPDFEQAERLRREIVAKNRLYFHRWRPQNETYLFGFRKHEQGQNAVEIPQFDPLVAAKEAAIHSLAEPLERLYQLVRLDLK